VTITEEEYDLLISYIIQDLTEEPNKYKDSALEVESKGIKLS
jgi:hypothetical protein